MDDCLILEVTESTNSVAHQLAGDGAAHGYAVLARAQTNGRGRLGRSWVSLPGLGLYCTIILRPVLDLVEYPKLTLAVGVAVAEVLAGFGLAPQLKWPNDIFLSGRKCGGILLESSALQQGSVDNYVLVGIGLNISGGAKDLITLAPQAISLCAASDGRDFEVEQVFSAIRESVLRLVALFERSGFAEILVRWQERDFLKGQRAQWLRGDGQVIEGVAEGIDGQGQLRVRSDDGVIHPVISGDVSLVLPDSLP